MSPQGHCPLGTDSSFIECVAVQVGRTSALGTAPGKATGQDILGLHRGWGAGVCERDCTGMQRQHMSKGQAPLTLDPSQGVGEGSSIDQWNRIWHSKQAMSSGRQAQIPICHRPDKQDRLGDSP